MRACFTLEDRVHAQQQLVLIRCQIRLDAVEHHSITRLGGMSEIQA